MTGNLVRQIARAQKALSRHKDGRRGKTSSPCSHSIQQGEARLRCTSLILLQKRRGVRPALRQMRHKNNISDFWQSTNRRCANELRISPIVSVTLARGTTSNASIQPWLISTRQLGGSGSSHHEANVVMLVGYEGMQA